MTTTVREQVISRINTVVSGMSSPPNIYRNPTTFPTTANMPFVVLYDGDESIKQDTDEFAGILIVHLTANMTLWVTGVDDNALGPALNDLMGRLVTALTTDSQLNNGIALDIRYDGMDQPVTDKDGTTPRMGAVLRFQVRYQMAARDPTSQG
jgi:hypothetical protein